MDEETTQQTTEGATEGGLPDNVDAKGQATVDITDVDTARKVRETAEKVEKEKQAAKPSVDFDALKTENAKLREIAQNAAKQAEASQAQVSQIIDAMQRAAAEGTVSSETAATLAEQLQQDPERVLNEHYNKRTAPLMNAVTQNQAQVAKELAIRQLKEEILPDDKTSVWEKYGGEIEEFLKPYDVSLKTRVDAWTAAAQWVRSRHVKEEVQMVRAADAEKSNAHFSAAPTAAKGRAPAKKGLSEAQKKVAKGLGLTDDEYSEFMLPSERM